MGQMSKELTNISPIEAALLQNNLAALSPEERLSYYKSVCESLGLNTLTQPLAYITLNGKLTLYAKKDATDQLRKIHKVSVSISDQKMVGDVYVVTAKASDASGREDESTGAVATKGLGGEALANAMLKAESKAKRRVTLSFCGLGLLDESEARDVTPERVARPEPMQIENLTDRPAFEEALKDHVNITKPVETEPIYIFKTGGSRKGKPLTAFTKERLNAFIGEVDKMVADGKNVTDEVMLDYNAAVEFLMGVDA
jgi:hypothetical protein